jgi:dTMP kinase
MNSAEDIRKNWNRLSYFTDKEPDELSLKELDALSKIILNWKDWSNITVDYNIVFEGTDGSGTSTQTRRVAREFEKKGYFVIRTDEPGNGRIFGENIYTYLNKFNVSHEKAAEWYFIDRMHWPIVIDKELQYYQSIGALESKKVVLLRDRCFFSSFCYQPEKGVDLARIALLNEPFLNRKFGEATTYFILVMSLENVLKRIAEKKSNDKFEGDVDLQKKLINNYAVIQDNLSGFKRYCVEAEKIEFVDGNGSKQEVTNNVLYVLKNRRLLF